MEQWLNERINDSNENSTLLKKKSSWLFRNHDDYKDDLPGLIMYTSKISLKKLYNTNRVSDFNLIGLDEDIHILNYIFSTFDFSFVKIAFDGTRFYVENMNAMLNKQGYLCKAIKNTPDLNSVIKRYQKYKKRHFQFDCDELNTMKNIRDNMALAGLLNEEISNACSNYISIPRLRYIISQILPNFYKNCKTCGRPYHIQCKKCTK